MGATFARRLSSRQRAVSDRQECVPAAAGRLFGNDRNADAQYRETDTLELRMRRPVATRSGANAFRDDLPMG